MSIASFIPSVWEQALITEFRGVSVANLITTPPTEVSGGKAIFNRVSGGTLKDYTGEDISFDDATTTPIELTYDKKKYFAIQLNDVDKAQARGEVLTTLAKEKGYEMKETIDKDIFAEAVAKCVAGNKIGSTSAKIDLKTKSVYDLIVDLGVKLSKKKVPVANRFVIASSEYVQELAKDDRFARNYTVLENGVVQGASVNGMTVIQSEDVPANVILCLHKSALGHGLEIDKVEAGRREANFGDFVKGLTVYGQVALRTEAISMAYVEFAQV